MLLDSKDFYRELDRRFKVILERFIVLLQRELEQQGHVLTGALKESFEIEIQNVVKIVRGDSTEIRIVALEYWEAINSGVSPEAIQGMYAGRGGGGRSKYITGLRRFLRLRGTTQGLRNKRAAFAIANAHSEQGMPTANSRKFSKNGRRTGFFDITFGSQLERLNLQVEAELAQLMDELADQVVIQFKGRIPKF